MTRRLRPAVPAVLGCLLVVAGACDLQEPERYIRAPVIKSYAPRALSFTAAVGDSLLFSLAAIDPSDQVLDYRFTMADSVAAMSAEWLYVVDDTGAVDVNGIVSNGVSESAIHWRVNRIIPENLPPEILKVVPPEPDITIIVGDAIDFSVVAVDPEGRPLSYAYAVGDSIVGASREYTYQSSLVGIIEVRALVSDGESFVSHAWTLHVAAEPDSVIPAQVVLFSIEAGSEAGEIDVEWIAVGDDSMTGVPSHYVLRTSPVPILDEHAWSSSSNRGGEPAPALPGEIMRMTVRDLPPAQIVYVAVRAVDDFGLISPLSPSASTRAQGMTISGTVREVMTGAPIENICVKLLAATDTTGADGSFVLTWLPAGQSFIRIEDEAFRTELGEYFDVVVSPYVIRDKDVIDVPLLPNIALDTDEYPHFLAFYKSMTDLDSYEDILARWDLPCKVYVPPLIEGGLDYRQVIQESFREWETVIGLDVFEFVEAIPDVGVFVEYTRPTGTDYYIVTSRAADGLPIQGRITLRTAYSQVSEQVMRVVVLHEVGHALGLNHSLDIMHLMVGGAFPQVQHPSQDEGRLIRAIYRIPRGFPAAWYRED
jgi:hypothetical protein